MDGRKNNGGNKNAGRKSKSEEQQLIEKLSPLENIAFKALKEALKDVKSQSWAVPLFFGYMYGKPTQRIDAKVETKRPIIIENLSTKYDIDEHGNSIEK